jgi:L-serine dehydratase
MGANELARMSLDDMNAGLDRIFVAMFACIDRGMREDGILPGGLRSSAAPARSTRPSTGRMERQISDPLAALDWVNLWALAVNEENAAGGRVVTAPTNGAAGLLPAVLRFFDRFHPARPSRSASTSC